jgi:hypothetical protein
MDINNKKLPNFKGLNKEDGKIYGRHNTVTSVNPYQCRFVATYSDGSETKGIDLFHTGWDQLPQGLIKLRYELSTGHVIEIPKYKAYLSTIETSFGMDGSRVFHYINVNCLAGEKIIVYKIVLRQDNISKFKIGDIIMSKSLRGKIKSSAWKYTS